MTEPGSYPPVSTLRLFLKMGGWIPLIVGLVLVVVTVIGQISLNTAKLFEDEGREAIAVVKEKYATESRDSDGDRTVTYWLTLEYETQSGKALTHSRTVNSSEYRSAEEGGELSLLYLEKDPTRTELTEGSYADGARVAQIIALIIGLMWLGALWITGRWAVEGARARLYGACEEAEVTQVVRTAVRVNNKPRYRLLWTDGQGRQGKSLLRKRADLEGYSAGDRIRIYQGLKRPWWAGDIGDRPGS